MNEFLFSTYINFIIVFINYNFFLFIKMVMISNWSGTEKRIFCFNNGCIKLCDGYSKIKKCLQNHPFARRFSPFTFSELKVKFLFLAYNFSCRFRPRYLWQRLHSTKGDKKSHYLSVKITLQIYYDVILLSYYVVLVVHFPRCNAGNIRRLLRLNWSN